IRTATTSIPRYATNGRPRSAHFPQTLTTAYQRSTIDERITRKYVRRATPSPRDGGAFGRSTGGGTADRAQGRYRYGDDYVSDAKRCRAAPVHLGDDTRAVAQRPCRDKGSAGNR